MGYGAQCRLSIEARASVELVKLFVMVSAVAKAENAFFSFGKSSASYISTFMGWRTKDAVF